MKENGLLNQLVLKTQEKNMKFNTMDDGVTLSYENVIFPSLILMGGILLSVGLVAVEKVWFSARGKFFTHNRTPSAWH